MSLVCYVDHRTHRHLAPEITMPLTKLATLLSLIPLALGLSGCPPEEEEGDADSETSPSDTVADSSPDHGPELGDWDADTPDAASWDRSVTPWPMYGGDPQRSGRSPFVGPQTYTAGAADNWVYEAAGGASINIQPTIDDHGIYFGSWGIPRGAATDDPATSIKSDGKYYGLDRTGAELFEPFDPHPLPACYRYPAEPVTATDEAWCGAGNDLHVTFYNGTIEGGGLVDPWTGVHYVGRGDGRMYAIDPVRGEAIWIFETYDPTRPDHPDGGGEVVQGAAMGPDGTIYFATFGVPWPGDEASPARETQAVYAVDRDGELVWRYPSADSSLENSITAAVALSPDGRRLYAATWLSDISQAGRLLAFDLDASPAASDEERLAWALTLENTDRLTRPKIWTRHISVAADGTVLLAGSEAKVLGASPVVVAVADRADRGEIAWLSEPEGYPGSATSLVQGLALGDGVVFATTADVRTVNGKDGSLFALDLGDGSVLAQFDPGDDAPGSATGPLLDASDTIYFGTRGRHDLIAEPYNGQWRRGTMFAVAYNAAERRFEERWRVVVDALLDWATPALDAEGVLYFGSTAPLPTPLGLQNLWQPLDGTPPHTTPLFFAIKK